MKSKGDPGSCGLTREGGRYSVKQAFCIGVKRYRVVESTVQMCVAQALQLFVAEDDTKW